MATNNTGKTYKRYVHDPRVSMFQQFYLSPTSTTFWNILQSGLRAGYSLEYSQNISSQKPKWWLEMQENATYKRARMLASAENNLVETIETDTTEATDTDKKLKHDATKFVAERLGKEHYSTRTEVTGKDGRRLFDDKTRESSQIPLTALFKLAD